MSNGNANGALKEPLNPNERGPDGLWPASDYTTGGMGKANLFVVYAMLQTVFTVIGAGVGFAIVTVSAPAGVLRRLDVIGEYDLGALYLLLVCMFYTFHMISANMGTHRRETRVNVPDQHAYRVYGPGQPWDSALVLMNDDGDFGKFNRGQRALANFEEMLPMFLAEAMAAGFVFPWVVMTMGIVACLGRLKGAVDYARDRKARTKGNMLSFFMHGMINGLVLFVGIMAIVRSK